MLSVTLALALTAATVAPADAVPPPALAGRQAPAGPTATAEGDAKYYFLLGRHLEGAGKVDEAVAAFKKSIALEPKSAEPRAELAGLYARQEKVREAVDAPEDALRVAPKTQEANRILGTVLAGLAEQRQAARPGDDVSQYAKRAIAALEIARGDGTGDLNIDLTLGRLYLDAERYADAIPLLRRIVLEQPQYAEGWLLLAEAQEGAGGADTAVETLTQLLDEQPQFFRARVQLAETYDRAHKWAQAADAWAAAQALNPRNTELAARHATALINADHPADALGILRDALKQTPGYLRLTFMLAQAQRDAGDLAGAAATAKALHDQHPDDVRFVYLMSQMMEAGGRYQEMVDFLKPEIARLRAGTTKGPQVAMLLGSEGLALQQLRKYDEALAAYKEAVTLAPDDPVRQVLLIQGYSAAGRHKEAIDTAEKARAKFPKEPSVVYQLGAALDRAGKHEDAEKTFRELIAQDPLDAGALNYLGYMLVEHGSASGLAEAVTLIQRALKVDPDNPSYLDSLGWAYVQQGKLDLADPPLSTAAEKMPANSVIQEHLGDLRQKQNRRTDAIAAWQKALAGDGDSIDRTKIQKKIDAAKKTK
jgi:tetratricopeptide (TPR) repeat protein